MFPGREFKLFKSDSLGTLTRKSNHLSFFLRFFSHFEKVLTLRKDCDYGVIWRQFLEHNLVSVSIQIKKLMNGRLQSSLTIFCMYEWHAAYFPVK